MREHHLIVALWGERYRNYFTQHCLPSLRTRGNRFQAGFRKTLMVACPADDWRAIEPELKGAPLTDAIHYDFPAPQADVLTERVNHATGAHAALLQRAYEAKAIVTILTPDMILSDGAMTWAAAQILAGKHLALAPAMRFAEQPLLSLVKSTNPRDLVRAAMQSHHSEMTRYAWHHPSIPVTNYAFWWPAPNGMLVHSFSWAMLMMDMADLNEHKITALQRFRPVDAHYVWSNWGDPGPDKVAIAHDSDDAFWLGFGPNNEHGHDLEPAPYYADQRVGQLAKGATLRAVFRQGYDPLKQRLFFQACAWHADDLSPEWQQVERQAYFTLRRFVRPANHLAN